MTWNRRMLWILPTIGLAAVALVLGTVLASWRRPELRLADGRLRPCPASPNCVCSEVAADDAEHFVSPLETSGDPAAAWSRLRDWIARQPEGRIVSEDDGYLHAEFITPWLRYVDDVELRLDHAAGVIHVRSASRVGRSDFGVNRRRVETLRGLIQTR